MKYINKLPTHKYTWLPVMYKVVYDLKPKTIIEYGTGSGGTAVTMGLALLDLYESFGHVGKIKTYDLFETEAVGKYIRDVQLPFTDESPRQLVNRFKLNDIISIEHGDFSNFTSDTKFDLLYFDIGNHGVNILDMYNLCKESVEAGSVILFEGGSDARDNVEWMSQKQKIQSVKHITGYKLISAEISLTYFRK